MSMAMQRTIVVAQMLGDLHDQVAFLSLIGGLVMGDRVHDAGELPLLKRQIDDRSDTCTIAFRCSYPSPHVSIIPSPALRFHPRYPSARR